MAITIYGASDDTIVVSGDITEEFNALGRDTGVDPGGYLAFSDGTILQVKLTDEGDDGTWRISLIHASDEELLTVTQVPVNDPDGYSDRAELRSDCDWVVYGTSFALNRH